jgi:hypothetical protein
MLRDRLRFVDRNSREYENITAAARVLNINLAESADGRPETKKPAPGTGTGSTRRYC